MPKPARLLPTFASVLLLCLAAGCATPTRPDVGVVVVAPKPKIPPEPSIVTQTEPKPVGYFQQSLLDYSNGSKAKPTKSTSPTQPAGQTPAR